MFPTINKDLCDEKIIITCNVARHKKVNESQTKGSPGNQMFFFSSSLTVSFERSISGYFVPTSVHPIRVYFEIS